HISRIEKWFLVVPTFGLVILCAVRLNAAAATAMTNVVDTTPWKELATGFREGVGPERTPVVEFFSPEGTEMFADDYLWFSYFAGTALPWCGYSNCDAGSVFPQSRIYSFLGKPV